jgi:hypothetical protein
MDRLKPATFVLDAGEYADKLPPCHHVEMRCKFTDRKPYEKMKSDFVALGVTALNAAVVTGKLQQMASGFVYDTQVTASEEYGKFIVEQTPIWFSDHKFDLLNDLLEENQHANTLVAYTYKEELAELKRRYPKHAWPDDPWNAPPVAKGSHKKSF